MKKNRLIFYAIFAFFQVSIFLFTVYMDVNQNDTSLLFAILNKIWMLKYGALIGILLLATDIIWLMREERDQKRQRDQLQSEMNTLKAKLFDLQEAAKRQSTQVNPNR